MKIQKQIDVRLVRKGPVSSVRVVQYDTGVQLVFNVLDFDLPKGTTATLYVRKKSGKFVYQETGITVVNNTVTVDLENQALTEHGEAFYQLKFLNGTDIISTFASSMDVDRSIADADAVESSTVIAAFEQKTEEQIAAIEAAAQDQIEVIRNLYNTYATKNEAAYAIKGKLSGAVVSADDVSTMEHNPVVKVRGKNLIPFPYSNNSGVVNGITYTVNDDGSVTAKGTATSNAALYLTYGLSGIKGTVFLSGCPAGGSISASNGGGYSLRMNKVVNGVEVTGGTDVGSGNKITLNGESIRVYIVVLSGKTVDCTFYPMLNYGDSANDFVKSELTNVTVRRCGKNIFEVTGKTQTINGVTFTVNANGTVSVTGTAEKATFISLGKLHLIPEEKYRLSGSPAGSGFDTYMLYIHNNTTGADTYDLGEGKVFTGKDGDIGVTIAVYAGNTVNNLIFRPMVVYGEESGDFEPYNGAEYIPAADGTVSGVTSLSPNMTILTDTAGAIVECEYNVDTKTYIKNMLAGASTTRIADVELLASAWEDTELPYLYAQVINIPGTTEFSQVNLNPSVEQMAIFYEKNLSFMTENEDGVVTVYAIGQKPMNDYVIQTAIREVSA